LIGRDLAEIFKPGHIYEIRRVLGEFLIEDKGESSLLDSAKEDHSNLYASIETIMSSGKVYFTREEMSEMDRTRNYGPELRKHLKNKTEKKK
jgi:hypothetical protein